ncbi:hypothetical protein C8J57DRAFT_1240117 [Mycena rebaudengoi]|nr:hypothetical protein C8J57DRAFT_1240117 [Mycena rebaudengoi]
MYWKRDSMTQEEAVVRKSRSNPKESRQAQEERVRWGKRACEDTERGLLNEYPAPPQTASGNKTDIMAEVTRSAPPWSKMGAGNEAWMGSDGMGRSARDVRGGKRGRRM